MNNHPDVHLSIQSPRAGRMVRLESAKIDDIDGILQVKIVPCDADGRTRADQYPSPETVKLESSDDVAAFRKVAELGSPACWLRCEKAGSQV